MKFGGRGVSSLRYILKVVHYQINHLIVVCDINFNSFQAYKRRYEVTGGRSHHANI